MEKTLLYYLINKRVWDRLTVTALLLCLCLTGIASADIIANNQLTFQDPDDANYVFQSGQGTLSINNKYYPESYTLKMIGAELLGGSTSHGCAIFKGTENVVNNYFAFTFAGIDVAFTSHFNIFGFKFFDVTDGSYSVVGSTADSLTYSKYNDNRWELTIDGAHDVKLYIDGVYTATVCTVSEYPQTFGIIYGKDAFKPCTYYIDDITIGSAYSSIMSSIPKGYNVLIDPDEENPPRIVDSTGTGVTTDEMMHLTYAGPSYPALPSSSTADTIKLQNLAGTVVHTENITANPYAGIVTFNLSETCVNSGLYFCHLKDGTYIMDMSYFTVVTSLDNHLISFDKSEYALQDTANISWDLDTPNFDSNTYQGELYSLQSGSITTWDITSETGTKNILLDSDTCSGGDYFAVLKLVDGEDEYWLTYDTANVIEAVAFSGHSYNLETGAVLAAVDYNFTQLSTSLNGTTYTDGNYSVSPFDVDNPVTIQVNKTGYTYPDFVFTPLEAKTYDFDIYLLPDNVTYTGTSIAGFVHNYLRQPISGATVDLVNITNTTSSDSGYYILSDLRDTYSDETILASTSTDNESFTTNLDNWTTISHTYVGNLSAANNTQQNNPYTINVDYTLNTTDGAIKPLSTGSILNNTTCYLDYDYGTWQQASHPTIISGTETVTNLAGTVSYVKDTDYGINYSTSSLITYPDGNITADSYYIDYEVPMEGTATISASKDGYINSEDADVSLTQSNLSTQNLEMAGVYALTVAVRDVTKHNLITSETNVELYYDGSLVSLTTTTNGTATFHNLDYGIYTVLASTEGYYTNQESWLVDEDQAKTIYLTVKPDTSAGMGVTYPPHNVKFAFKTLWGAPIVDADVSVQGFETTAGAWEWFISLIGLDTEETPIHTGEMNGTTDTNGEIDFMMIESVKYHIIADKDDLHTDFDLYPKDDYYPITVGIGSEQILGGDDISTRDISINVTTTREDDLGHIHVQYTDTGLNTDYVKIDITQINATNTSAPEDLIQTYGVADTNDFTHTFDETECSGQQFFVRITITHETGTVYRDYGVSFRGPRVRLGNIPDGLYIYVAALGLCIIGCIFGATSANQGMIIVSFTAWIFFAFGWLDDLGLMGPVTLSFATVLSVLAIIMRRYHEAGYT